MIREWGVRYNNGKRSFVAGGFTRETAERKVAEHGDPKRWRPVAEAVMVREVGDWELARVGGGQ